MSEKRKGVHICCLFIVKPLVFSLFMLNCGKSLIVDLS